VVTVVPLALMQRTRCELYSAVKTLPRASTATPVGLFHAKPPPRLLATPAGDTTLILLLPPSAVYTLPAASTARRAPAVLKVGEAPSAEPALALPSHVDTVHSVGVSALGQAAHAAAPPLLAVPGALGAQGAAPPGAAVPAGHLKACVLRPASGHIAPLGQATHVLSRGEVKVPAGQGPKGEGEGVGEGVGEREGVRLRVGLWLGVGLREGEGVQVGSGEGEPVRVAAAEGEPDGDFEAVPLGEAPWDGVAVREGDTLGVREALLEPLGVRVALAVAVGEALAEGLQGAGGPPSSMRRMRLLRLSATYRLEPATARPQGELNLAAVPSAKPPGGEPASVPTTATGNAPTSATCRMLWLMLSAINRAEPKKARALGPLKSAAVPMPLTLPPSTPEAPPPASVATLPLAAATTRTFLLPQSATYRAPVGAKTARPLGEEKRAPAPAGASTAPAATANGCGPASGTTAPSGVTMRTA
jgi:hypothetical protein